MTNPLGGIFATLGRTVLTTGTDTDAGKTYATAALAVAGWHAGHRRIAVYKPQQTGVRAGDPGDVHDVARLARAAGVPGEALTLAEGQRLTEPMAPPPAAAVDGVELLPLDAHARKIVELQEVHDLVLVEGSGGVLVELDGHGRTVADLAVDLQGRVADVQTVLVARPDLGTLNHTLLSLEALLARGVRVAGVVLGSWPAEPDRVQVSNREHLADLPPIGGQRVELLGAVPRGWGRGAD